VILGQQFKILNELGSGGMGIVYQGVDVMLEREVAIKRMRSEFSSTPEVAERFQREAKIQARLNHPNITHLYSFFKEGDAFYIVMEFVNGTPLRGLIPLPWAQALPVFLQILDSLEYAHSLGVLHRDLKPDNIMVSSQGEAKVMDFGIAHVLGAARQTRDKSIIGTLEYVSPEQITGRTIDQRSDIYSLGILMYEMVSGKVPFASEVEFELLKHHLDTPPPRLSSVVPGVPEFLEEAVAKALSKEPEARFAGCSEMAAVLRSNMPATGTRTERAWKQRDRNNEVDRCVRRIEALLAAGEPEVAALVLRNALADSPGDLRLAACEARLRAEKGKRAAKVQVDEKSAYLHDVLLKLGELEASGQIAASWDLAKQALSKYPGVPAFQIACARFRQSLANG